MSGYGFERRELESASEAWRPLDRALLRWVLAHGGSALLATTAAWASLADGRGDTVLPLGDASARREGTPEWDAMQIAALRAEPMVSADDRGAPTPFVLDADGRFYLWRNRRDESVAIERLHERRACAGASDTADVHAADLQALFHGRDDAAIAPQRAAVRAVAGHRLFVLTGGPGTGKTTTVLRMLLMLQRSASKPLKIQLAAPTGKAAQRLAQSLRDGKHGLLGHPGAPLAPDWRPLLDRIPDAEALTLHRLLGYQPWNNRYARNARHPVTADVVVVDEASMIDLSMLRRLLDALRPEAILILVGDADQLASIAAGSALMDLVLVLESEGSDDVMRLQHSFRSESALVAINAAVRGGDASVFAQAWSVAGDRAVERNVADPGRLAHAVHAWADGIAAGAARPVIGDDAAAIESARNALKTLAARQLLCALREGPFGSLEVSAAIERRLRLLWHIPDSAPWYPGRAVMVVRNDYERGLYNGDVGLCLADPDGELRVWFESSDDSGHAGARSFATSALPSFESAYAITVHKSQGSEYDRVAILLPPDPGNRILSRQLLYTGLSRAREALELWGTQRALEAALARPVRRASGLAARLLDRD